MIKNKNKFTYNMRNEKGITLMALVVTIIVMLILSTITITTLIKPDNLVSSVENEKSKVLQLNAKQEVDVAIEKLKLANGNIKLTVSDFSKQLEEKLRNNDKNAIVTPEGEGYKVIYNGYTFNYYYYTDFIEVTFDANGGTINQNNKLVTYDETYGELPIPTRNGYNFAGWYIEKNGGTKVESTTKVTLKTNHTLYANWIPNKYTVSYDANGGTGAPSDQIKIQDEPLTLSTTIPTRENYIFSGWSTSNKTVIGEYASGGTYTENVSTTLYAVWVNTDILFTKNGYNISLSTNDAIYTKKSYAIIPANCIITFSYSSGGNYGGGTTSINFNGKIENSSSTSGTYSFTTTTSGILEISASVGRSTEFSGSGNAQISVTSIKTLSGQSLKLMNSIKFTNGPAVTAYSSGPTSVESSSTIIIPENCQITVSMEGSGYKGGGSGTLYYSDGTVSNSDSSITKTVIQSNPGIIKITAGAGAGDGGSGSGSASIQEIRNLYFNQNDSDAVYKLE